jgi:hypothetical protein
MDQAVLAKLWDAMVLYVAVTDESYQQIRARPHLGFRLEPKSTFQPLVLSLMTLQAPLHVAKGGMARRED